MKQLSFLQPSPDATPANHTPSQWTLYTDGASRNNPGPSGAGIYLLKDGQTVSKEGFFLGNKTNNQAEYLALLIGLHFLKRYSSAGDGIRIASDSELLVKQLKGEYKVRHPDLKPLYKIAHAMVSELNAQIMHVVRSDNVEADKLANLGIDKKKPVPQAFITLLQHHGLSL